MKILAYAAGGCHLSVSHYRCSSSLITGTFLWTPSDRIGDPSVNVGFSPTCAVGADPDLRGERALSDFSVDGGPGKACSGEDGFQADDTVWFAHGWRVSWLFLTARETRQDRLLSARKRF